VNPTARLSNEGPLSVATFSAARRVLNERPDLGGRAYCEALNAAADSWLDQLFAAATEGRKVTASLIAVGGYGRGELCPGSDIDVVLLHRSGRDIGAVADALWYPIWDDGVHLDYSVRTPDEMFDMASRDVKVALGLLTARPIAGDTELAANVIDRVRSQWSSRAQHSLNRLRAETEERWQQYGELAFVLEPDLKRARGGMRDIDAVHAAVAAVGRPVMANDAALDAATELLLTIRVALHQLTGRATDQLVLDEQDRVAVKLGFSDADALMAAVASAGRRIAWTTDDGWHRINAQPRRTGSRRELGAGLVLLDGEVALTAEAAPSIDSSLALRAAAAAAEAGAPLARGALDALTREAAAPPVPWPGPTRDALIALLGFGAAAIAPLETLDQIGVLERYLPEWVSVRSRPQRNAYHRFTVDRHLCEAMANAARLVRDVHRPDLLLVGTWLHDIGKGAGGDHTVAGERIITDIATRMGFAPADVDELVRMVRYHLLLAEVATRRDLDDVATIAAVAEQLGTHELLDLLAALTFADGMATGPAAWGDWKADLVTTLVDRTHAQLAGEPYDTGHRPLTAEQKALIADGKLRVVPEGAQVTVVARDRPGLLAVVAGTFALHKLQIRGAVANGDGDMACDVFELDSDGREPHAWDRIEADLALALDGQLDLEGQLARRIGGTRPPRRTSAARPPHPRVLVDNAATPAATVVEVRAPDGIGLLYRITEAIASTGFDIASAKLLTLGHEVVDTFYVVEAGLGRRCTNPAALRRLEDAVLSALRRPW
jgi:[protein-PII] uridylyltransferase